MRNLIHWLNALLLAAYAWWAATVFDRLPERVPLHFGASGVPDRWAETDFWSWFLLFGIALGVTAALYASAWWILWLARHRPTWVNLPERERFLKLETDDRVFVVQPLCALVYWLAAGINALIWASHFWSYQVAVGAADGLPALFLPAVLVVSIVPLFFVPAMLGHIQKRLEAVEKGR
jgi:hypothetical protein